MAQMDLKSEEIAKTENFMAWKILEPDDETTYHIEFGKVTVHFFLEEWDEFLEFVAEFVEIPIGTTGILAETESYLVSAEEVEGDIIYSIEMPGATLFFFEDDWKEILELFKSLK